jgi:hypothetical protein
MAPVRARPTNMRFKSFIMFICRGLDDPGARFVQGKRRTPSSEFVFLAVFTG